MSAPPKYVHSEPIRNLSTQKVILQDSATEEKDSINSFYHQITEKQDTPKQQEHYSAYTIKQLSNDKKNWSLALSYSGGEKQTNTQRSRIPGDISSGDSKEVVEKSYHHIPITLSLSVRKNINEHWGIETGVRYTYLRSDFTIINDSYLEKVQKISYIGIPFKKCRFKISEVVVHSRYYKYIQFS